MNRVDCTGGGTLLLTAFPGLNATGASVEPRSAVIGGLADIAAAGASVMLTLVEHETLARFCVSDFGALARAAGLDWRHLPIADFAAPDAAFIASWRIFRPAVHARLGRGETAAIHCRAGLGRTGTVAAMILIERGATPDEAIATVRRARPGAIETVEQEAWVRTRAAARDRLRGDQP